MALMKMFLFFERFELMRDKSDVAIKNIKCAILVMFDSSSIGWSDIITIGSCDFVFRLR